MSETDATETAVIVVGGGPAGLSAALFTQKNGLETTVFDTDETWLHKAHLFNYLGIGSVGGSEFIATARQQVDSFGVELRRDERVTAVEADEDGFVVETDAGAYSSQYVIFATGADRTLAIDLGCETTDEIVDVNLDMETSITDAYATGAMVRAEKWEAAISVGDGAAAALDVISKERGERYHDFDVPADAERAFGGMADE